MVMKTVLNVKMDSVLKRKVQETAQEVGLPVSLVFANYARQFVQEKQVTFSKQWIPNKRTASILDKTESDALAGKNYSKPLRTKKEIHDYIMSL